MKKITLLFFFLTSFVQSQIGLTGSGFTATGAEFTQLYTNNEVVGTLTSIDIDATLAASTSFTYANDLTILVTGTNDFSILVLQAGGFSDFSATERISWTTGGSEVIGTQVMESQPLTTPLDFSANPTYNIWLGNGYANANPPTNSGTWDNINIVLNGISEAALSTNSEVENAFSIYPNPTEDFISISNTNASLEINKVGIIDVNGRAIRTIILGNASNNSQINVSDLSAGIYMLVINSNKGTGVKKFVKR